MKQVEVYTDGACSGNPGPGGWLSLIHISQWHPQCPAGLPHKGFVPVGGGAAQAVVHMAG